jgi:putative membrane protein
LTYINAKNDCLTYPERHFSKMEDPVMRKTLSTLPFALILVTPLQAIAQQQQPSGPPQDYYWPGPWHMMWGWGMFPMMLLFFILFFVVVFFFARGCMGGMHRWGPSHPMGDPTHSALQILNERFAKGEINQAEYEERRRALRS